MMSSQPRTQHLNAASTQRQAFPPSQDGLLAIAAAVIAHAVDIEWLFNSDDPVARWFIFFGLMALLLPMGLLRFGRFLRANPVVG
jgi:hypothetical protein